jgi:hypothetical protein
MAAGAGFTDLGSKPADNNSVRKPCQQDKVPDLLQFAAVPSPGRIRSFRIEEKLTTAI